MVERESAKSQALKEEHEHDLTIHVFTISAGMVGVCLTGIGLLRVIIAQTKVSTFGDDLLLSFILVF